MGLKTYLQTTYPTYTTSGSIYQGYMDMTYFSFTPESLKRRKLKIAIVFMHADVRFEIWLSGYNKKIQTEYWNVFSKSDWDTYHIVPTTKGVDSIVEYILVDTPDFSDLDMLTNHIEKGTMAFIRDIEDFLSTHKR